MLFSFKCFKYYGAKTTIDQIFEPLKKIQIGEFEDKLKILLNILDIFDNKLIIRSEMEKFLSISFYQSYEEELSTKNIIDSIFPSDAKFMEYNTVFSTIMFKKSILIIFKDLLQSKEEIFNESD